MKKNLIITALILIGCSICADQLNKNPHVHFGYPGKIGTLFIRSGYAVLHNNTKKVPVWVSYCLTDEDLKKSVSMKRDYKSDPDLKSGEKAEPHDYEGTAYDRANMAPVQDMLRNKKTLKESCYLSNVCPMRPELKRGKWKQLEDIVRNFVKKNGTAWIIAGPIFKEKDKKGKPYKMIKIGSNNVYVPTHFYKIIIYQSADMQMKAIAFLFENKAQYRQLGDYTTTIEEIEGLTGLHFINLLPDEVQKIIKSRKATTEDMQYLGI